LAMVMRYVPRMIAKIINVSIYIPIRPLIAASSPNTIENPK
jgi:hypothetical protein